MTGGDGAGLPVVQPFPVVVDASVGVKWAVREEHSAESLALLDVRIQLVVPDLFYLEVGNTLGKKVDRGEIGLPEAHGLYQSVLETPYEVKPSIAWAKRALDLAVSSKRALYDSIYLTIAISMGGVYATADRRYINGLFQIRPDLRSHILWVADIPGWLASLTPSLP